MSKANTAAEPSMEEILASIRRIIADEDAQPKAPSPKSAAAEAPPQPKKAEPEPEPEPLADEEDVLDLAMAQAEAEAVAEAKEAAALDDGLADLGFVEPQQVEADPEPEPEPDPEPAPMPPPKPAARVAPPPSPPPERAPPRPAPLELPRSQGEPLLSEEAGHAASQAFGALAHAIFSHEPRTIEDLTKELLRPMVKSWLDDNLPGLVERLVREEIERVARGRR